MRLPRSEVFEEYAKIADQMGLYREEKGPKSSTPGVIDNPNNGADSYMRWDPSDISDAEAFYGVKPNKNDEMLTRHIMEQAHPESVVIAPSYDRINGLVENNIERQKILINIIGRPPTGNCNHRKLAQQEMLMELVRLGNQLDNSRQEQLRALADSCMQRLAKEHEPSYEGHEFFNPLTPEDDDWIGEESLEGMTVPEPSESSFVSAVGDSEPMNQEELLKADGLFDKWCEEMRAEEKISEYFYALGANPENELVKMFLPLVKMALHIVASGDRLDFLKEDGLDEAEELGEATKTFIKGFGEQLNSIPMPLVETADTLKLMLAISKAPKMVLQTISKNRVNDEPLSASDQNDVSPKGWGKTVEKMKKHRDISNPFALAYWMKGEGYKPHPNKK